MSGRGDAVRAAQLMEATADCTAVPWRIRGGWGVAIHRRRGRRDLRWAGPVDQGWAWLRQASPAPQAPAGEAPPPGPSPAGQDG